MFNSYYDNNAKKACPIANLVKAFEKNGSLAENSNELLNVACSEELAFTAEEWKTKSLKDQQDILMNYRIAYLGDSMVNWCPKLGTVLANDEVSEGLSLRGGYPVEQKVMRQWCLRISAYAQRLLDGLDTVDWTDSLRDTQRNWIGRSEGAELHFKVQDSDIDFTVFTTRADTIFGVTFMVLAPESELVASLTTPEQKAEVNAYILSTKKTNGARTHRRQKGFRRFLRSLCRQPFHKRAHSGLDQRLCLGRIRHRSHHGCSGTRLQGTMLLPSTSTYPSFPLIEGADVSEESFDAKEGILMNSGFLNGLTVKEAIAKTKEYVKEQNLGRVKVNYRLRDAIFSRQRYWGEPFPVYYKDGMPYMLDEDKLPLELPEVDKFLPTATGEPPLGNAKNWKTEDGYPLELNTMPGFAGSSAYYLRYMDPHNDKALVSKEANTYWEQVDLYVGGTEHATGHLIYSRFWNKFLFDLDVVCKDEPFKRLINQGMIQGRSNFVYRIKDTNTFVSYNLKDQYDTTAIHADVNIVSNDILDIERFKAWSPDYAHAEFILEDGKYICGWAVEKMSKSMYNVVNPDDIVEKFGADTLRLYEMFLGPIEQSKPWDTNGIDGVHRFLRKVWNLCTNEDAFVFSDAEATKEELKALHKLIKKISWDIEHFSFNTSVSAFMICVNELAGLKCNKRSIIEPLIVLLTPFAPHFSEEIWEALGNKGSVCDAKWPEFKEAYLEESVFNYPISFNGKTRFMMELPADMGIDDITAAALSNPASQKWLEGKTPKKMIVVPKKIVNIVL